MGNEAAISRRCVRGALLALLAAWPLGTVVADSGAFAGLRSLVPERANAILLIDYQDILRAPLAVQKEWREQQTETFIEHGLWIPAESQRLLLAADLDLSGPLQPAWEIAILEMDSEPSLEALAKASEGTVETIGESECVLTDRGNYLVQLGAKRLATVKTADRQFVARWLRSLSQPRVAALSDYLAGAVRLVGPETQIVLALDLADALAWERVAPFLEMLDVMRNRRADAPAFARILASLKGATVTIHIGTKIEGALHLECGREVAALTPFAKPIVLESLSHWGAALDDLENWATHSAPTSITLKGTLSAAGLRRVLGVLAVPEGELHNLSSGAAASDDPAVRLKATQDYFRKLQTLIGDTRNAVFNSNENQAYWSEKYADRIDHLPFQNVDESLLTFAGNVSKSLRYQAAAKRMAGIRGGLRESQLSTRTYSGRSRGRGRGSAHVSSADYDAYARVRLQELAKYRELRNAEWKKIDEQTTEIRHKLGQQYKAEF